MKTGFRHFVVVIALGFGVVLTNACQTSPVPVESLVAEQDSLMSIIEQKIESKKQQQAELEKFRKRQLPRNFSEQLKKYFPIIRKYTARYKLDWRLTIAQILKESYFKENAMSNVGAMGLMQIMPRTAREITSEIDIAYITKDPNENITAGIYYMYKQLKNFPRADPDNRIMLALAAYNAGIARVYDAQDIARVRQLDPNTWAAVKECLPLLTDEHWKLHLEVWELGHPTFGYFYGYEETIDYVDDIMKKYDAFRKMYRNDVEHLSIEELSASM